MPCYHYECEACGHVTQRFEDRSKRYAKCESCGVMARRKFGAGTPAKQWAAGGLLSDAAGVHPAQIQEAMAYNEKHGIKTEYKPDGRAVFRDRGHRRQHLKAWGYRDLDGGYGD